MGILRNVFGTDPSEEWRNIVRDYCAAVNGYFERFYSCENLDEFNEEFPEPPERKSLMPYILSAIKKANRDKTFAELRSQWPPASGPLSPLLKGNCQEIPMVFLLDDGSVVARIGGPLEDGRVVRMYETTCEDVPGFEFFGRSPNRRYFAYAEETGVRVTDGWLGPDISFLPWPTGREGVPVEYGYSGSQLVPRPSCLMPFPDGRRVLFAGIEGVFVLSENECVRLLPTAEKIDSAFENRFEKQEDTDLLISLDAEHGVISPDGKWVIVGCQDSNHLIFDEHLQLVADIHPSSEYAQWAHFSGDSALAALSSCYFYGGRTIGLATQFLPGFKTVPFQDDERMFSLQPDARVHAAVHRKEEFILGDAGGSLYAVSNDGRPLWYHAIGGTIGAMDVSPDGGTLVVSSYNGWVVTLRLDAGGRTEYEIGNGNHHELQRWVFWKGESKPLLW